MKPLPSSEAILQVVDYNAATGVFTWKSRPNDPRSFNSRTAGKMAGNIDVHGYRRITMHGSKYWAHRLAWKIMTGDEPETVDHINGDPRDNRFANLRAATNSENLRNRGKNKRNSSGFKGVYFSRAAGKYAAQICVNMHTKYLGLFVTREEASAAYEEAARTMHGEFANHGRSVEAPYG